MQIKHCFDIKITTPTKKLYKYNEGSMSTNQYAKEVIYSSRIIMNNAESNTIYISVIIDEIYDIGNENA